MKRKTPARLNNVERATIAAPKVVDYLLSTTHRSGKSKAAFFLQFGFSINEWHLLAHALRRHAQDNPIAYSEQTPFGLRVVIDGSLHAPDGSALNVRSVWFIDSSDDAPRFVTAHPLRRPGP